MRFPSQPGIGIVEVMRCAALFYLCSVVLMGCSSTRNEAPNSSSHAVVDLVDGAVELPSGFTHTYDQGIDSIVGHFTSPDGKLVINHDIGNLAGVYALHTEGAEVLSSTNVTVNGLTALIVVIRHSGVKHVIVSFPEGGPANFFAVIRNDADFEAVTNLSLRYRLKQAQDAR